MRETQAKSKKKAKKQNEKTYKLKDNLFFKKSSGITLIALVVTIIILLILSGVTINMLLGEDGIIKKASDVKNRWEDAAQKEQDYINSLVDSLKGDPNNLTLEELEKIYSGEELIDVISQWYDENQQNIQRANAFWFGDSLMYGTGNSALGFPEVYYGSNEHLLDFSKYPNTVQGLNIGTEGATINVENPNIISTEGGNTYRNCIRDQIGYINQYVNHQYLDSSEVELLILSGCGNDVLSYLWGGEFEVPVNAPDGTHSIISDFKATIEEANKMKEIGLTNKNLKIIYMQTFDYSKEHIINVWWNTHKNDIATSTRMEEMFGVKYENIDDYKNLYANAILDGSIDENDVGAKYLLNYIQRASELDSSIQEICKQYNIEYFDIAKYIPQEEESYYIEDSVHYNKEGYELLNKFLTKKIDDYLQKPESRIRNAVWIGDNLLGGYNTDGFPEKYHQATLLPDFTIWDATFSKNLPSPMENQLNNAISQYPEQMESAEILIISAGMMDVLYDSEVTLKPILGDTDSVSADIKSLFNTINNSKQSGSLDSNIKLLFVNTFDYDINHVSECWYFVTGLEQTVNSSSIEDLQSTFGTTETDKSKYKDIIVNGVLENDSNIINIIGAEKANHLLYLKERSEQLESVLPQLCEEYNIEYYDITTYLEGTGKQYYQTDSGSVWFNEVAYDYLLPYLIEKIESMF